MVYTQLTPVPQSGFRYLVLMADRDVVHVRGGEDGVRGQVAQCVCNKSIQKN